jgi:hypothetical protein
MEVPIDILMSDFILCMEGDRFHRYSLFSNSQLKLEKRGLC